MDTQDTLDIQAAVFQAIQAAVFQAIQDFLDYQDIVDFQAYLAIQAYQDIADQVFQDIADIQAYLDIQDQVYLDTVGFQAGVASKEHPSTSKAQWPHQPICHPLATVQMMPTLLIQLVTYMFGMAVHGTMLAK